MSKKEVPPKQERNIETCVQTSRLINYCLRFLKGLNFFCLVFIEATGIARLRDPLTDSDPGKVVKQKLKERMNPKLGKIDIDYEVLHDAFFKHQSKSKLTSHGDMYIFLSSFKWKLFVFSYYEGKEDEVKMKSYKPGKISDELRVFLLF